MKKTVQTVLGPVPVDELGPALTHEHLWMDTTRVYFKSWGAEKMSDEKVTPENRSRIAGDLQSIVFGYKDNVLFDNADDMAEELKPFRAAGGKTIFEVTTEDLGRDPLRLREISEKSGVHIIMGGTFYYFPSVGSPVREMILNGEKNKLADHMIREFFEGAGDTGIKPGILGEVGLQHGESTDRVLLDAVMTAQKETGAPVIIHSAPYGALDAAEREGADLSKIVMGHWTMDNEVEKAVKRGAWVSFDQFGMNFSGIIGDDRRIRDVLSVFEHGWEKSLLLSQDVCWKIRLKKYGGEGYAGLFTETFPKLLSLGLTESQLDGVIRENPARLLS